MSTKIIEKYTKHISNMRLETHMRFICPECALELPTQLEWRKHLNEFHDYRSKTVEDFNFKEIDSYYHECQVCYKLVANANQTIVLLQYHYFLHLPYNETYRCRHCLMTYRRKRALVVHLCRAHGNEVGVQKNSELIALENGSLENHDFYIRFICPQCGMHFTRYEIWKEHLKTSHVSTYSELRMHKIAGTNNHYCLDCKKLFHTSDRERLQRHHFAHLPHKLFLQCAYCQFKRSYKSDILRHFIYSHTKEFLAVKSYVQKPEEFGATINSRLAFEIDVLLAKEDDNEQKRAKPDLLKRALMSSFMENEETSSSHSGRSNEKNNAFLRNTKDIDRNINNDSRSGNIIVLCEEYVYDSDELEELCEDLFEVIIEEEDSMKSNINRNKFKKSEAEKRKLQGNNSQKSSSNKKRKTNEDEDADTPEIRTQYQITKEEITNFSNKFIHFICPQCGETFDQQHDWRTHIFTTHSLEKIVATKFKIQDDEKSYLCMICKEVITTRKHTELQRHHFNHSPYNSYLKCIICNRTKSTKTKILQHFEAHHYEELKEKYCLENGIEYERPPTPILFDSMMEHIKETSMRLNYYAEKFGC